MAFGSPPSPITRARSTVATRWPSRPRTSHSAQGVGSLNRSAGTESSARAPRPARRGSRGRGSGRVRCHATTLTADTRHLLSGISATLTKCVRTGCSRSSCCCAGAAGMTSTELARELEVSVRTVLRGRRGAVDRRHPRLRGARPGRRVRPAARVHHGPHRADPRRGAGAAHGAVAGDAGRARARAGVRGGGAQGGRGHARFGAAHGDGRGRPRAGAPGVAGRGSAGRAPGGGAACGVRRAAAAVALPGARRAGRRRAATLAHGRPDRPGRGRRPLVPARDPGRGRPAPTGSRASRTSRNSTSRRGASRGRTWNGSGGSGGRRSPRRARRRP